MTQVTDENEPEFSNGLIPGEHLFMSTSFPDEDTAENTIQECIQNNKKIIIKWLKTKESPKNFILLEHNTIKNIGYGFIGKNEFKELSSVLVALTKTIKIKTAFPINKFACGYTLENFQNKYPNLFKWFCCIGVDSDFDQFNLEKSIYDYFDYNNVEIEKSAVSEANMLLSNTPFPEEFICQIINRDNDNISRKEWLKFFKDLLGTRIVIEMINKGLSTKKYTTNNN